MFAVMYEQYRSNYELPALPVSDYEQQLSLDDTVPR
jgi:hypothetical protein